MPPGTTNISLASETQSLVKLLRVIIAPFSTDAVASVLLDPISGVPVMMAHKFLKEHGNKISVEKFVQGEDEIKIFGDVLLELIGEKRDLYSFIQVLGEKFFFSHASTTESLLQKSK